MLPHELAMKLLYTHLTPDQIRQFIAKRYFEVIGEGSQQIYRIWPYGVQLMGDDGVVVVSYCIHFPYTYDGIPTADQMLALKLLLEANEKQFLQIANASPMFGSHSYDYNQHRYIYSWMGVNLYDDKTPNYLHSYFPELEFEDDDDDD